MSHRFELQRILELKEQIEDLLQNQVAGIEGERQQVVRHIQMLRIQWAESSQNGPERGEEPLDPGQRQEWAEYLAALDRRIYSHGEVLEEVDERLRAKRAELQANYKERELLQKLKEKRAAIDDQEDQRRDQRTQDDLTAGRYLRGLDASQAYGAIAPNRGIGR